MEDKFYQKQYFDQLSGQLTELRSTMADMEVKIDDIKSKVIYMYGFAAAIGLGASFVIDWVRTQVTGHP